MTIRAFDQHFATIYNDIERFPSLEHVAAEMECSVKTVRNRAGEMRSLRENGLDVPELISRVGTGRNAPPVEMELEVDEEEGPHFVKRDLIEPVIYPKPETGTRYFILSSAQDESLVHDDFLTNLEAYAAWLGDCQILIAGFTYSKRLFEDHDSRTGFYATRVRPYMTNDQIQIGDGLLFCGEMNTLPTARNPLSGFEIYTRDKWGIFPHAKIQLQSIANAKFSRTKQLLTTGTVTMPNYIPKKAGIQASFHHQIGAVIVELMADGTFFCRHLQADGLGEDEGGFYDLDRRVEKGEVTTGNRAEALTYGDIHHEKLDPVVAKATWGFDTESGKLNDDWVSECLSVFLKPRFQFFHDLSDFAPRNHHNVKDPHFIFRTHWDGGANVEEALRGCANFVNQVDYDFTHSVVVQSNHDNALLRWLKTAEWREDPENALFYLETQASYIRQLQDGVDDPPIFEQVLRGFTDNALINITFVSEDESFMICGDIECAMHGHLGANGARGNPRQFTRMGAKSNTAHTHTPQIIDGAYVGGVSAKLDLGYNRGLSSWAHAHILTYGNGARTILTMHNGRWYAPLPELASSGNMVTDTHTAAEPKVKWSLPGIFT